MFVRAISSAALFVTIAAGAFAAQVDAAAAAERDREFFRSIEGEWTGPGEIVAGKYEGTKFVCKFTGSTPERIVGMTLDGSCRVGVFTQRMSAKVQTGGAQGYTGTFMDGAEGKGLDVTGGQVEGRKVVFSLNRNSLNGAMLAHLHDANTMNITVSVRVEDELVPVIGVDLKRVDARSVGSLTTGR